MINWWLMLIVIEFLNERVALAIPYANHVGLAQGDGT
jgi:hypothetical protein